MIPHNRPTLGQEEQAAAARVLASGWVAQGPEVAAFEDEVCTFLGLPVGHAVAVSSGTAALFLALHVLGASGRRVACPVYACSALTNAIALAGASPVLLDTGRDSPNVDPAALAAAKADIAIAPHMFGLPIDLSNTGGIPLIEDCAQAIGARLAGRAVGLQGAIGIFSFSATKLLTSGGQGGMVVSRDRSLADTVRDHREFDCRTDRRPRFNFQMTDLQAAIGREQLRKMPAFLARRDEIFGGYSDAGFDVIDSPSPNSSVRYRAVVRCSNPLRLMEKLKRRQISAIVPVHNWELLGPANDFPNACEFARNSLSLPIYPSLSDSDVGYIIDQFAAVSAT
jgi:perosamine synthetase